MLDTQSLPDTIETTFNPRDMFAVYVTWYNGRFG